MRKSLIAISLLTTAALVSAQTKWFMAQTNKAPIQSVTATSELVEAQFDGKYLYPPINILDGDFSTTWCEAQADGSGIGEGITIEFEEPVSFDQIELVNGFATKDYYLKNNRVAALEITQVAGEHYQQRTYYLDDDCPNWQSIHFDLPQTAKTITLKIARVYPGSKYDDTCLADFRLKYKGSAIPFTNVQTIKKVQEENSRLMLKSDENVFKSAFYSHFGKPGYRWQGESTDQTETYMYLYPQNGKGSGIIITKNGGIIKYIDSYKFYTKDTVEAYLFNDDNTPPFTHYLEGEYPFESRDKSKFDYYVIDWLPYYGWGNRPPRFSLGNNRIIQTEYIDYVETTTVKLLKIDGNTLYLNGVAYIILDSKRVYDVRIYDGP